MIVQIIEKIKLNPKKLFLIDGFGAILSAFLLGVVLVQLERIFGIPSTALYFLATFPIIFAIYDFFCYRNKTDNIPRYLNGIAIMNLLYCCLSIGVAIYHCEKIKSLGWVYLLMEIIVLTILVVIELNVSKELLRKTNAPID